MKPANNPAPSSNATGGSKGLCAEQTARGATSEGRTGVIGKLKRTLIGMVSTPDHMVFWNLHLLIEGFRILRKQKDIRFIVTSAPPYSSLLAGMVLSRMFRLSHVIDLRDPWGGRPGVSHSAFRAALERRLERSVVRQASRIISSTDGYNRMTRERFPECDPDRFVAITNCFEPEKFDRIEARSTDKFTLCYLGIFYPQNNPYPFFTALRDWLAANPAIRAEVDLVLVGSGDPATLGVLRENGLEDILTVTGRIAHQQAIERTKSAHLLLLLMGRNETVHPGWVPAKLFEYLACRKPILAYGPEGEALAMVQRAEAGHLVTSDDPAGFIEVLDSEYRLWREGAVGSGPASGIPAELEKFTSYYTNRQFADLFDSVDR